jgi:hypothetical protein
MESPPDMRPTRMISSKGIRFVNKSWRQRGANSSTTSARNTTAVNASRATESFRLSGDGRLEFGERLTSRDVAKLTKTESKHS